ncbi:MAG: hypothetical protein RR063_09255 [Anaerovoracaceae bacterium]
MTANYEKGMYNQLIDVMARLDSFEKKYKEDVSHLNNKIEILTKENTELRRKNKLLTDDNERLRTTCLFWQEQSMNVVKSFQNSPRAVLSIWKQSFLTAV